MSFRKRSRIDDNIDDLDILLSAKVSSTGNHIIYSGDITHSGANEFQKKILECIDKYLESQKKITVTQTAKNPATKTTTTKTVTRTTVKKDMKSTYDPMRPLNIHITSPGGLVSAGLAMMQVIEHANRHIDTVCYAKGLVGSAATLPAFACKKRYSSSSTIFLLHPPSGSGIEGQTEDIKVSSDNIRLVHNIIMNIYRKHSTKPRQHSMIKRTFEDNRYSDAHTMIKCGLIDTIVE